MIEKLFTELDSELHGLDSAESPFHDGRQVLVYGAGNAGKDLARFLLSEGISVAGFLDRRAAGGAWEGIPLRRPEETALKDRSRIHVVIGIFNRAAEIPPILKLLRDLGYGRISTFLQVHRHFAGKMGDRFWLTDLRFYRGKLESCLRANGLWSDELSRNVFTSVLKFRFTGDHRALPFPAVDDQYFPQDLPAWTGPIRFIDCGAYDGDTLRDLLRRRSDVEALAAFEPDPDNFHKLVDSVRGELYEGAACLFPCGVSGSTGQLRFSAGHGESSRTTDQGEIIIQGIALDDAVPAFRPTLIKMDIEGAETEALYGARRLIERYRPGLAISVYHRPDDLWTIPILLHEWLGPGRHFLRAHAHNGFDLIYYWLPV